ncbi:hypothetical protein [Streptomyces shenzhenensis]|uniref:hypothetical protein n=1 Tax=Streptomyces shenzhenensis TaxID=943815 RepID=UPI001F48BF2C|nr:hypothetical protein [Streptomyces shenzhenensis]
MEIASPRRVNRKWPVLGMWVAIGADGQAVVSLKKIKAGVPVEVPLPENMTALRRLATNARRGVRGPGLKVRVTGTRQAPEVTVLTASNAVGILVVGALAESFKARLSDDAERALLLLRSREEERRRQEHSYLGRVDAQRADEFGSSTGLRTVSGGLPTLGRRR